MTGIGTEGCRLMEQRMTRCVPFSQTAMFAGTGIRYRTLSRSRSRPRFGARRPAAAARCRTRHWAPARPCGRGIPGRIGESRCFGSLQSELRPNQNWPCGEGQMGESGLSAGTGRGVRPGAGRVSRLPLQGVCGQGSASPADTGDAFRNEVATDAVSGVGRRRNPCARRAMGNTVPGVVPGGVWGSGGSTPHRWPRMRGRPAGRRFPAAVAGGGGEAVIRQGR